MHFALSQGQPSVQVQVKKFSFCHVTGTSLEQQAVAVPAADTEDVLSTMFLKDAMRVMLGLNLCSKRLWGSIGWCLSSNQLDKTGM